MPKISPKLGEFLVKTTKAKDIDDAFQRIFTDYLELKLKIFKKLLNSFKQDGK